MLEKFDFTNEFQDLMLACIIAQPDKFIRYGRLGDLLKSQYFTGSQSTMVARAVLKHEETQGRIPSWNLVHQLVAEESEKTVRGDDNARDTALNYVRKLSEIDTHDIEAVTERLVHFARERATIIAIKQSINDLKEGKIPQDGFSGRFFDLTKIGQNLEDIGILLHADAERTIRKVTQQDYGIRTGYPVFDAVWPNGWAPGWLIVPVAPPKRYKTGMCLNFATKMISPIIAEDVFYYSCEISQELALCRALACMTQLPFNEIYSNTEDFIEQALKVIQQQAAANLLFKHFSAGTATIATIEAHAQLATNYLGRPPRVIVIDYADTVSPRSNDLPDHEKQASVYTDARAMGERIGATVIMPDRVNKETVSQPVPNMTSFQGAFKKGGIVDVSFGLCQTETEYINNILRAFIFVNRHGPALLHYTGRVDPESMRISIDKQIDYDPEVLAEEMKTDRRQKQGKRVDKSGPAAVLPAELLDEDDD